MDLSAAIYNYTMNKINLNTLLLNNNSGSSNIIQPSLSVSNKEGILSNYYNC